MFRADVSLFVAFVMSFLHKILLLITCTTGNSVPQLPDIRFLYNLSRQVLLKIHSGCTSFYDCHLRTLSICCRVAQAPDHKCKLWQPPRRQVIGSNFKDYVPHNFLLKIVNVPKTFYILILFNCLSSTSYDGFLVCYNNFILLKIKIYYIHVK